MPRPRIHSTTLAALALAATFTGCMQSAPHPSAPATGAGMRTSAPSADTTGANSSTGDLLILGRILTMDEPAVADALLIRDGAVAAIGSRDDVVALAVEGVPVIDIGDNVAYPGFIDAHAHWIGDREYYGVDSAAVAMEEALRRGWTSISEQWVDAEGLAELEALAGDDALPIRVDAYLALNAPAPSGEHFGDWYADREPAIVSDRLRVQGVKVTLDNGWGSIVHWEPAELTRTIGQADEAGWQVSVHTVSTESHDMVLDAFEGAIGVGAPNPLHHRIDHAIQVTDAQLARMVAMNLAAIIHLDGAAADWVLEADYLGNLGEDTALLARWRDFVEAGLHVAAATDTPWLYPDLVLTGTVGRPIDQIAGGMDGRGLANPDTPAWVLDQLLTAEQGLRSITVDAAYALGDDSRRGHLAPGALGDVTILSGDVTHASADEIRAMTVVATIVGGIVQHCSQPETCTQPEG